MASFRSSAPHRYTMFTVSCILRHEKIIVLLPTLRCQHFLQGVRTIVENSEVCGARGLITKKSLLWRDLILADVFIRFLSSIIIFVLNNSIYHFLIFLMESLYFKSKTLKL